ncbi:MAG: CHAD domain-containing protein [Anaerolineales bacterium]|nr:CHAD domain-containing protein [Anaerolineales bacterium]
MNDQKPAGEEVAKNLPEEDIASADQQDSEMLLEPEQDSSDSIRLDQAKHVRDLALLLFDRTQPLHDLDEDSRETIELSALMHASPFPKTKKKPYKAALAWVKSRSSRELPVEAQSVLAAVLAYHQGKIKRKTISRLGLAPIQQRQVLTIAALLRIAVGLDDSSSQSTTIRQVELARDGIWIVVDGPNATADAAASQSNSSLWSKIGYPQVKVLESAEAAVELLPFPEPMREIGIEPGDTLAEAGRKVMRYHFAEMLRHEAGTRLGEDIEALHDMRVATRRMRAAFEVFAEAFEPNALKPHLRGLRAVGRALGSVRDLDVFMEKAQAYLETLPEEERGGLHPLLDAWIEQRQQARARMLAHLDSQEYADFKRKFNVFISTPGAGARQVPMDQPAPNLVQELAPALIYTRLAAARAFGPFLGDASIERLHALRIEFKKLRYSVEYFQEVLGEQAKEVIKNLKKLQDHLGDLNDAQVAVEILRQFIDAWEPGQETLPIHERQNIEAVVSYMAFRYAERHRLMDTFSGAWENFERAEFRRNLALAISVL